jgi:hypothetical protein
MPQTPSWDDGLSALLTLSLKEARDLLAEVAVEAREKRAAGDMQSTLTGGLLGAGLGGLTGALATKGDPEDAKGTRQRRWSNAMMGALGGGALGGGLGLAGNQFKGGGGAGYGKPGQFTDPSTGKLMQLDPNLAKDPDTIKKIQDLTNATPWYKKGPASLVNTALSTAYNAAPVSASTLPFIGAGDYALHSRLLNLGDKLGVGMIDPRNTNNPKHLQLGADAMVEREKLHATQGTPSGTNKKTGDPVAAKPGKPGYDPVELNRLAAASTPDQLQAILKDPYKTEQIKNLAEHGAGVAAANIGKSPHAKEVGMNTAEPYVRRLPGVHDHVLTGHPFSGARGYGRAALYGGLPLAEILGRSYMSDATEQKSLRELMARHAKPVQ